jgi:eukaryotic-like serine/threonine-protein kinase
VPAQWEDVLHGTSYRTVAVLGRGGMGEVLEAEHIALGKRVVVKLLRSELAARLEFMDRMRVEAQSLASLSHPNVVDVFDFGKTPGGRVFLVMERLYGRTLEAELLARGALPPVEAIDYVRQALAGLGAAHALGIVHRDIKLANLFLCNRDGDTRTVKVLDFGVAKILGDPTGRAPTPLCFPTAQGVVIGTPRYVSPEQVSARAVDGRADIYAMGVVLYALLVGRSPFEHIRGLADVLAAHMSEEPAPPSRVAPQPIVASLERAVMKALAKRPEERFESALAFSEELGRIATESAKADGIAGDAVEGLSKPLRGLGQAVAIDMRKTSQTRRLGSNARAPLSDVELADAATLPLPRSRRVARSRPRARVAALFFLVAIASALVWFALAWSVLRLVLAVQHDRAGRAHECAIVSAPSSRRMPDGT